MNAADRELAESVLRRLCVGAQIDGIRFGPVLQLLITDHATDKPPIHGQVYLNLESAWDVYPSHPGTFPRGEGSLPERDEAEQLRILCGLREAVIRSAELATDAPDLILTFEDGRLFLLNGRHDRYETWQLGVAFARTDAPWLVVACPGNQVAVWCPAEFKTNAPSG